MVSIIEGHFKIKTTDESLVVHAFSVTIHFRLLNMDGYFCNRIINKLQEMYPDQKPLITMGAFKDLGEFRQYFVVSSKNSITSYIHEWELQNVIEEININVQE